MKQMLLQEKYPVFSLELDKSETTMKTVDGIIGYFKAKIDAHKVVTFIAVFDHYSHTKALEEGVIDESILDAKTLFFALDLRYLMRKCSLFVHARLVSLNWKKNLSSALWKHPCRWLTQQWKNGQKV